jgi:two-component system sensor histidine kinase KdpD
MTPRPIQTEPVPAAFALPIAFTGMLLVGVLAVAARGRLGADVVPALTALLVAVTAFASQPLTAAPLTVIGWLTIAGFSRPPYGELHSSGTASGALTVAILAIVATVAAVSGLVVRTVTSAHDRYLVIPPPEQDTLGPMSIKRSVVTGVLHSRWSRMPIATPGGTQASGVSRRRLVVGLAIAAIVLPILTVSMAAARSDLVLIDEVLLYLLVVILVTLVGGFWPAVIASVTAVLLLNWYFTPPLHTWTIDAPQNILALLLFVASAVTISSVVHLAAVRSSLAKERAGDAGTLLALARTVLGGDDSPQTIVDHLTASLGVSAELRERSSERWIRVAGGAGTGDPFTIPVGNDLQLVVYGDLASISRVVLEGYATQAAAALERHRLRIQAGQAEALAEGNRMRTALLAAVSHDLRTPLASVKAAVSTLRQTDIAWTADDQATLLATIEHAADQLDSLIGNLLDMSRVQAGAVHPFVRPTALDEVAPLIAHGLDDGARLHLDIPDTLPLVATDPGLLERALANLVANALRYSPPGQSPTLAATSSNGTVTVLIVDHGPGVPSDQWETMFEPFQQLGDQHASAGVGLGLAVAKGFIDAIGGRITAASTPGGGLTMRVDLPAVHRDAATRAGTP